MAAGGGAFFTICIFLMSRIAPSYFHYLSTVSKKKLSHGVEEKLSRVG